MTDELLPASLSGTNAREGSELSKLMRAAIERDKTRPHGDRMYDQLAARRRYVVAEMQIKDDDSPSGITEAQALAMYEQMPEGWAICEIDRLRALAAAHSPSPLTDAELRTLFAAHSKMDWTYSTEDTAFAFARAVERRLMEGK